MSSLGSQWRVIRHYLSLTNLNAEVEKLVQKIKPATPEQWENLITRFEKAVSIRLTSSVKEIESTKIKEDKEHVRKATTVEETEQVQPAPKTTSDLKEKPEENEKPTKDGLLVGSDAKDITLEGLWQGFKLKKDLHFGKISEPSWKSTKPVVTKTSIHSRTSYVVSALVTADSTPCLLQRTDQFIAHLHLYPEARDFAIKEGAVRALLRIQNRLDDDVAGRELRGAVNEALALLGHVPPPPRPGPNILSLDGGGIRGIIAIEVLRHLERVTGRRVHELFDYIIGVSTGAIIAAVIGGGKGSLDTAGEMYQTLAKKMFGNTSIISGASRLVWSHSYYDTAAWEALLRENLPDCTLSECNRHNAPKLALVSCVVNAGSRLSPFLFRSYECGFRTRSAFPGTARAQLWHAVRASAAAPTYFDEFTLHGLLHQDGGILVNNPAAVGLHEARLLFGRAAMGRAVVVSVGTGRAPQPARRGTPGTQPEPQPTSWRDKFNKILDSATDTEGVHHILNDMLPAAGYYRFNPPLLAECAMDEVQPERLASLRADTAAYIRRNEHKFSQAAAALTRPRPLRLRLADELGRRAALLGLTAPE